jgi:hypothetical protein
MSKYDQSCKDIDCFFLTKTNVTEEGQAFGSVVRSLGRNQGQCADFVRSNSTESYCKKSLLYVCSLMTVALRENKESL